MKYRVLFYASVKNLSDFHTSSFYGTDIKILTELGFDITITNKTRDFFSFNNYDVAFIYFYRKGLLPAIVARIFGKKIFFTGGIDDLSPSFASPLRLHLQRALFILCYCISTICIIVSESDKRNIQMFWKWDKKMIVIPHVVETERFNPNILKQNIIVSICWMGTIANVQRKGVDRLIRGFSIFSRSYPTFMLFIIGRFGEGYQYLRKITEECGVEDKVQFPGPINENEKIEILSKSKYYGQLSQFEGFGLAALEAMAAGCIIIHTAKGGLREILKSYGVLVQDMDDPERISDKLCNLERKYDEFRLTAMQGCKSVRVNFDYSVRYYGFKKIFENL